MFLSARFIVIALMAVIFCLKSVNLEECGSISVRLYEDLPLLTNCSVVLGNLALVFPIPDEPNYSANEINNWTFPLRLAKLSQNVIVNL